MHKVLLLKLVWYLHTHASNHKILMHISEAEELFQILWKVIYWTMKKCTLGELLHEFMTIFAQKKLP